MTVGADSGSALHSRHDRDDVHDVLGVAHRILVGSEQSGGTTAVVEDHASTGHRSPATHRTARGARLVT